MGCKRALLIGNSVYDHSTFPPLIKAEADIHALVRVLSDPDIGGFEVTSFINEPVAMLLQNIELFFLQGERDDFLLLYFSGHGELAQAAASKSDYLYLLGKDTKPGFFSSSTISSSFLRELMDRSKARTQVLVLDCCYSGTFLTKGKAQLGEEIVPLFGRGHAILTSSSSSQRSWVGDNNIPLSLFTYHLVRGLETGAADKAEKGWITLEEWFDYASRGVTDDTSKQTPSKSIENQQGSIVIAKSPHRKQVKFKPLYGELLGFYADLTSGIETVTWSPDGQRIALGGYDHCVQVWNVASGEKQLTYTGHGYVPVWNVAWSSDGRYIASCSGAQTNPNPDYYGEEFSDTSVKIWDSTTGEHKYTYSGHNRPVMAVAWSPDGTQIASTGDDQTLQIWDSTSGHRYWIRGEFGNSLADIYILTWSPGGKYIASVTNSTASVWTAATGERVLAFSIGLSAAVAWSPDEKWFVCASAKGVQVWSINGRYEYMSYLTHSKNSQLIRIKNTWDVRRYLTSTYEDISALKVFEYIKAPRAVVWSHDELRVASASDNSPNKVWVWVISIDFDKDDKQDRNYISTYLLPISKGSPILNAEYTSPIKAMMWSPDGTQIAFTYKDWSQRNIVGVWRLI